jgi:hypothetical protein
MAEGVVGAKVNRRRARHGLARTETSSEIGF